jgi:hypothetical protein
MPASSYGLCTSKFSTFFNIIVHILSGLERGYVELQQCLLNVYIQQQRHARMGMGEHSQRASSSSPLHIKTGT